ncbi:MAG: PstS family phosphate ABC transporter substrate-binding protein [Candidatus Bathyarchaeia archaeon]|nr:PstS family phosphate ABC transporter substrate-binding protein [Candidatus Bathyarchaeota archaeon]
MKRSFVTWIAVIAIIIIVGISVYWSIPKISEQTKTEKQLVNQKGSDTLLVLAQIWAEVYMAKNPNVQITVSGGGSGTGIAALINKQIDMADASREIKDKEIKDAKARGVEPVEWKVAIDGISVIVHPSNPLDKITLDQLKAIYNGSYTNWRQLGGPDKPINTYGRQSNSGTYVYWQEHILQNQNYRTDMQSLNGNADIVEAVSKDPASIGYVGVAYAAARPKDVKTLSVQEKAESPAYPPTPENIVNKKYPISRYMYIYTDGIPKGAVREYLKFIISDEGQRIVEQVEYIPLPEQIRKEQLEKLR